MKWLWKSVAVIAFNVAIAAIESSTPILADGVTNLLSNGDFSSTSSGLGTSGQISPATGSGSVQNLTGWTMGLRTTNQGAGSEVGLGFYFASGEGADPDNGAGAALYGPLGQAGSNYSNNGLATDSSIGGGGGGNYVALDADITNAGTLSQTVSGLTPGAEYILSFYWGAAELYSSSNTSGSPTTESLLVGLGSQTQSTETLTTAFAGFDPWQQATMVFTAASSSEVLAFLAIGTPNGNPPTVLLDSVVLQVDEPRTDRLIMVATVLLAVSQILSRKWDRLRRRG